MRTQSRVSRYILLCLSGLAGGIVLIFKLVLLPVIGLFWLTVLIASVARCRNTAWLKLLFRIAFPILFGIAIPVVSVVLYFAWHNALSIVGYTYFEYPAQAVATFAGENRLSVLKRGLYWFQTEQLWVPHGDMDEQYRQIQNEVGFLSEPNNRPGKIFVCAQPLYYYLSKRSPALASNGWMPKFFLPEQWNQLSEELAVKTPPYIAIENYCRDLIDKNSPETAEIL